MERAHQKNNRKAKRLMQFTIITTPAVFN